MISKIIFHASSQTIQNPQIIKGFRTKDFGFGFYCTNLFLQAKKWATRFKKNGFVNEYIYTENTNLKILKFDEVNTNWLHFIMQCRAGENHNFDIVEGAMADDQVYNYIQDYQDGNISETALLELVKFRKPTHQIVFCSEVALQNIQFKNSHLIQY